MQLMQRFWQWFKDRWVEHQALTGHGTPSHTPQQGTLPIVGIAEDAYLQQLVGSHATHHRA